MRFPCILSWNKSEYIWAVWWWMGGRDFCGLCSMYSVRVYWWCKGRWKITHIFMHRGGGQVLPFFFFIILYIILWYYIVVCLFILLIFIIFLIRRVFYCCCVNIDQCLKCKRETKFYYFSWSFLPSLSVLLNFYYHQNKNKLLSLSISY